MNKLTLFAIVFQLIATQKSFSQNLVMGAEAKYSVSNKNALTRMNEDAGIKYIFLRETETEYYYLMYAMSTRSALKNALLEVYSKKDMEKIKSYPVVIPKNEWFVDGWGNGTKMAVFSQTRHDDYWELKMYEISNTGVLSLKENFKNPANDKAESTYSIVWSQDRKLLAVYNRIRWTIRTPAEFNLYVKVYDNSLKAITKKTIPITMKDGSSKPDYSRNRTIFAALSNNGAFGYYYNDEKGFYLAGITKEGESYNYPITNIQPKNFLRFAIGFNNADELTATCLTSNAPGNPNYKKGESSKIKMIYYWHFNEAGEVTVETKKKVSEKAPAVNQNYEKYSEIMDIQLYCTDSNTYIIGERGSIGETVYEVANIFCVSLSNLGELSWAKAIEKRQIQRLPLDQLSFTPYSGFYFCELNNKLNFIYTDNSSNKYDSEHPKDCKGEKNGALFLTRLNLDGEIKQDIIYPYDKVTVLFGPEAAVLVNDGFVICPFFDANSSALGKIKLD